VEELRELKRVCEVDLFNSVVLTSLYIAFSLLAHSHSLLLYFAWAVAAYLVKVFGYVAIRIMLRENEYLFPYGTGKVENFSAFLFGVSIAPMGVYFLVTSVLRLVAPPGEVAYGLCLVPVAVGLLCATVLGSWLRRIAGRYSEPSPLLVAFRANVKVSASSDVLLLVSFAAGAALHEAHFDSLSTRVDPLLTLVLAAVMVRSGSSLIVQNLRALLDLPLPEKEMMPVLRVLAEFVESYGELGQVRTRRSGRRRIVEMELAFAPGVAIEHVREVERRMGERLTRELPDSTLTVVAMLPRPIGSPGA